jgi:hypothetical protein
MRRAPDLPDLLQSVRQSQSQADLTLHIDPCVPMLLLLRRLLRGGTWDVYCTAACTQ